jgi:hypothetical protein
MALFIELTTDAFQETFARQKGSSDRARRAGASNARRPTRGLELKDDTYAILKVVTSTGEEIPLIDAGSPNGLNTNYTNFILQSVTEARMEKHQIVETFGDPYIYFFGESPRFLDVQAVLVDSLDFNWYAEFWANYNLYLRGTKSVEMGARTYLFYDDNIVEGYMIMAQATKTSDTPLMVRLQFRLYLTNYDNVSFVGDPNYPVRDSIILPQGVTDVNQFTQDEAALDATLAANLQSIGFGGGTSLIEALQQGVDPGRLPPGLQGIVQNAAEAFGGVGLRLPIGLTRQAALRSLISDNADEYTGSVPSGVDFDNGPDLVAADQIQNAWNLAAQANEALRAVGADFVGPTLYNQMGLGVKFGVAGVGIGFGAVAGARATFGSSLMGGASFGVAGANAAVGVGGGFGFSGRVGAGIGLGGGASFAGGTLGFSSLLSRPGTTAGFGGAQGSRLGGLVNQLNAASFKDVLTQNFQQSVAAGSGLFQNGVRIGGSLTSGVGVVGGVQGGLIAGSLFNANPQTALGSIPGTGNGANVNVGGSPSAFSLVSAQGKLTPDGFSGATSSFGRSSF